MQKQKQVTTSQIISSLKSKLKNWKNFSEEEVQELRQELIEAISNQSGQIKRGCVKYDVYKRGVIQKQEFMQVLGDLNVEISPECQKFLDVICYSQTSIIDYVPYSDLLQNFTGNAAQTSPDSSHYTSLTSQSSTPSLSEVEDDEEIEVNESTRQQIFYSIIKRFKMKLENNNYTIQQIFKEKINAEQLYQRMLQIGISDLNEIEFTVLFRGLGPEIDQKGVEEIVLRENLEKFINQDELL